MADIVLTDEIKEKLKQAGALGFDLENTWPYVPEVYLKKDKKKQYIIPKKFWPVFTLRCLDGVDSSLMQDKLYGAITVDNTSAKSNKSTIPLNTGAVRVDTCRLGILDWKNYRDVKGKLIPEPTKDDVDGGIAEDSVRLISPKLQIELANAITEYVTMSNEEALGLD